MLELHQTSCINQALQIELLTSREGPPRTGRGMFCAFEPLSKTF